MELKNRNEHITLDDITSDGESLLAILERSDFVLVRKIMVGISILKEQKKNELQNIQIIDSLLNEIFAIYAMKL
jgi:hypothetical protein